MEWRCLIYLVLVSLLWPVFACGAEPVTVSPEALKAMAASIRQLVEDDEAVGAEVLILHKRQGRAPRGIRLVGSRPTHAIDSQHDRLRSIDDEAAGRYGHSNAHR